MGVRLLVIARAFFLLLFIAGCSSGAGALSAAGSSTPLSGIFDDPGTLSRVLNGADTAFAFTISGNTAQGAVRIMPEGGAETQQSLYEAPLTISQFSVNGSTAQLAGQANLGSDLGTFSFSGTIADGAFSYTYTDALESGSDIAPYLSAVQPTKSALEVSPSPYVGTWTLTLPDLIEYWYEGGFLSGATKRSFCQIFDTGDINRSSTTFNVTVTNASVDANGFGIDLSGTASGGVFFPAGTPPYAFRGNLNAATGDGSIAISGPLPHGIDGVVVAMSVRFNGWFPPAAASSVEWRARGHSDRAPPVLPSDCWASSSSKVLTTWKNPKNYLGP